MSRDVRCGGKREQFLKCHGTCLDGGQDWLRILVKPYNELRKKCARKVTPPFFMSCEDKTPMRAGLIGTEDTHSEWHRQRLLVGRKATCGSCHSSVRHRRGSNSMKHITVGEPVGLAARFEERQAENFSCAFRYKPRDRGLSILATFAFFLHRQEHLFHLRQFLSSVIPRTIRLGVCSRLSIVRMHNSGFVEISAWSHLRTIQSKKGFDDGVVLVTVNPHRDCVVPAFTELHDSQNSVSLDDGGQCASQGTFQLLNVELASSHILPISTAFAFTIGMVQQRSQSGLKTSGSN